MNEIKHIGKISERKWGLLFSFVLIIFLLYTNNLQAQEIKVTASLDSNLIRVGDQINLTLEAIHPKGIKITWPPIPDTLGKIEVFKKSPIHKTDSAIVREVQQISITSFDSGIFVVPSFVFQFKKEKDTASYQISTDSLRLLVRGLPVDTSKAIRDIKSPLGFPFTWRDAIPYIAGALGLLALAAIIYYLIKKYRKRKPEEKIVVVKRPPHELALEELNKLEKEKRWQQGELKEYHSRLTEIIRIYIENRFEVPALEQTTDEIMQFLKGNLTAENKIKLKQILELADLVKFAKAQPVYSQNEMSMRNAHDFVNSTKKEVKV